MTAAARGGAQPDDQLLRRNEVTESAKIAQPPTTTAAPASARAPAPGAVTGNQASANLLSASAKSGGGPTADQTSDAAKTPRAVDKRPASNKISDTAVVKSGTASNAYGTFMYAITKNAGANGCEIQLSFSPFSPEIDATRITFIQAIGGHQAAGAVFYLGNDSTYYAPFDSGGMYTDHLKGETDPFYNYDDKNSVDESVGTTAATRSSMHDTPHIASIGGERGLRFESAPFVLTGKDRGEFLGTLTWGWQIDAAGTFSLLDVAVHDDVTTTYGSALRKFIDRKHNLTKGATTPAMATLDLPADRCRDLSAAEKLALKPTIDYAKGAANARVWVVIRYTDDTDRAMAKDNALGVQKYLTDQGVPAKQVHVTFLAQPGVAKLSTTPIEVTVIDT